MLRTIFFFFLFNEDKGITHLLMVDLYLHLKNKKQKNLFLLNTSIIPSPLQHGCSCILPYKQTSMLLWTPLFTNTNMSPYTIYLVIIIQTPLLYEHLSLHEHLSLPFWCLYQKFVDTKQSLPSSSSSTGLLQIKNRLLSIYTISTYNQYFYQR